MGIAIRETKLVNDRIRLSLDIYHSGKSKFENLRLIIHAKPKTSIEKEHNKNTWKLAESIKAKRILELQDNNFDVQSGFKYKGNFLEYFKKLTDERKNSLGTYSNWYSAYRHLVEFSNGRHVTFDDVSDRFLIMFKEYLLNVIGRRNKKLIASSAANYLTKIKSALKQAEDERIISDNPAKRIKGIKTEESYRNYLLKEEMDLLVKTTCSSPIIKKAFLFSCLSGLRWSDIEKLTWGDLIYSETEAKWKIHFRQKKTRTLEWLPLQDQAKDLLGNKGDDDQRVFKGLTYGAWNNVQLKNWIASAGIKKQITFHCARHTFATLLLTNGVELYTVSK